MVKRILLTATLLIVMAAPGYAENILRLATTTSTYETGLLDHILPGFEKEHNCKVHVISVGTGKAIKLAENGDVDVILVHAREDEDRFVEEGYGVNRRDVMYNDFIVVGPVSDPAGIRQAQNAREAFRKIKETSSLFVSRGDNSGTYKKEQKIWEISEITPGTMDNYFESGQGMNQTLRIADEKDAYCLVDRASYLAGKDDSRLEILLEGDDLLLNPYGVIAVNPKKFPHIKYDLAMDLVKWLTDSRCQKMIAGYRKNGNILYHPNAITPVSGE